MVETTVQSPAVPFKGENERELGLLRAELAEREALGRVGEAADVVLHEFSNLLNAILLQTAVLQQKVTDPLRSELNGIRDQGRIAVDLMRRLQMYRRECRPALYPVDLNRIVREAALASGSPTLYLELAAEVPFVLATLADLKLLTALLVKHAVAVTPIGSTVRVRTLPDKATVRLQVEDAGPPLAPEMLARLFDPCEPGREGANPLELAVCQTLVRHLNAVLRTESRVDGVNLFVELKTAG